ncbi:hypothetical protein GR160_18170 [Flavobacterium sp. Sd200]|uniref:hypothetical protein n=1 Tax=Flavobacterium sp. Sd200 TaxID=2692211 RepID=UPI00136DF4F9|nr:hypothetical protein [Flavobacterium sp. Sd200]MXN93158.1 hypothetical protein [Flavobacterium sp. Sd200]
MEHYFVVLELPGGEELKFKEGRNSPDDFWETAAGIIDRGEAQIISKRQDTGVSEELRKHLKNIKKFTTFVLVHTHFCSSEFLNEKDIFKKLSRWLHLPKRELVIDTADNFQLVTIDM